MGNTKLCTQAEFARMHEVSRKTATQWKARGWLVFHGDRVDIEATNARLKKHRRDGVTQHDKVTKVTGNKLQAPKGARVSRSSAFSENHRQQE